MPIAENHPDRDPFQPPEKEETPLSVLLDDVLRTMRQAVSPQIGIRAAMEVLRAGTDARMALLYRDSTHRPSHPDMGQWRLVYRCGRSSTDPVPDDDIFADTPMGSDTAPARHAFSHRDMECLWVSERMHLFGRVGLLLHGLGPAGRLGQRSGDIVALALRILTAILERDEMHRHVLDRLPYDPVTQFLNARGFQDEVTRRLGRLDWQDLSATLLVIRCAELNDVLHGLSETEALAAMEHAAALLRRSARPTDVFGRIAHDHFAIWLDGCDRFAASERAERITTHQLPLLLARPRLLGLRIGLAEREPNSTTGVDELITRAEAALLDAEATGRKWMFDRSPV